MPTLRRQEDSELEATLPQKHKQTHRKDNTDKFWVLAIWISSQYKYSKRKNKN